MKKLQKLGFTLIELMIVISIMTIIGATSFFYFGDMIEKTSLSNVLSNFSDDLKDLDNKIKNYNLQDYKIVFKKDRAGYYVYENYNFSKNKQELETIDFDNGTGKFGISGGTSDGVFIYNIYFDEKLIEKDIAKANVKIELKDKLNFSKTNEVFIKSFLNSKRLNNIRIKYFSLNNIEGSNSRIILKKILCDTTEKNELVIVSIGGKKEFKEGTNICSKPKLVFEQNGVIQEFLVK